MRSFPTRLANSVTRTVFLAPCLLVCLACATPFPIESLEEGMTGEAVREKFGAPEAMGTQVVGADSSWTSYVHEEQNWFFTVMASTLFLPHCIFFTAATAPFVGAEHWCDVFLPVVGKGEVLLHFEEEKLVRWDVIEPVPPAVSSGYTYQDPFPSTTFPTKDSIHHDAGHKHHHGHK